MSGLGARIVPMEMFSGLGEHDELAAENIMQSNTVAKRRRRTKTCNKLVSNSSVAKKPAKKVFPGRYCVICGKKGTNLYKLREGALHQ